MLPLPPPLLPQYVITSGTRKDCIRLRGLPYEALVEHILEFMGEHAKHILYRGVHMVYNAQVFNQSNFFSSLINSHNNITLILFFFQIHFSVLD